MRIAASTALCSLCLCDLPAQWQAVPTTTLPPPRLAPTIGEGLDDQLLLFGGQQGTNTLNDLWQFTGTQWVALPTPPIAPRRGAALAFDRERNQLVLFGGRLGNVFLGDTQLFDGTTWSQSPSAGPSARSNPGLVYDARRRVVVLFGGNDSNGALGDHWEWNGSSWAQVLPATTPPPLAQPTMAYDETRQEVAMMSGQSASQLFIYDGSDWSQPAGALPLLQSPRIAADPIRGRLLAVGVGTASVETWEWDGLDWQQVSATAPTSIVPALGQMAFDRQRREVVFIGPNHGVNAFPVGPKPLALPFGVPCVDPARQLRATAGSSAEPGSNLLLETTAVPQGVLGFGIAGTSRTQSAGTPLPTPFPAFNPNGCDQQVANTAIALLPNVSSTLLWQIPIPNNATLLGAQLQTQVAMLGAARIVDATNGLEIQVGLAPDEQVAIESFSNEAGRDPLTSGDRWGNGSVQPIGLGGDGRHGSFDPTTGLQTGSNVFQFSTDKQVIPGSLTLSGNSETVMDGQFHFTDFKIPANVTVRFRGSHPAILRVRGAIEILGKLDLDAARMTRFNAQNTQSNTLIPGQDGGVGGPGGGAGGRGGNRCPGTGPTVVNGVIQENGQAGEVVQVAAGHAYALQAVGTEGQGGLLFPAHGISPMLSFNVSFVFNGDTCRGGGGGGFATAGSSSSIGIPLANFVYGPPTPGGTPFPLVQGAITPPQGSSSLEHFTVGGSGGGGGGSHPVVALSTSTQPWKAGAGGSGGGGAAALRSGGTTHIGTNGSITARGGAGAFINGDNPNTTIVELATQPTSWGISSPGGGGSGGSVLLQSANDLEVFGSIDSSGGGGSSTGGIIPPALNGQVRGGAGSDGFVRLEALGQVSTPGTFVPPLTTQGTTGPLLDRDSQSGSRSTWRQTSGTGLPVFVRYELLADVNGQTQLFSDDPSLGVAPADDPAGPVQLRLQTARAQVNGAVDPTSIGPWRDYAGSQQAEFGLSHDRGDLFRFDLVINDTVGTVSIRELRVIWR